MVIFFFFHLCIIYHVGFTGLWAAVGFLPVSISTRTVNRKLYEDCDTVECGASAAKRPHNHVLVVC